MEKTDFKDRKSLIHLTGVYYLITGLLLFFLMAIAAIGMRMAEATTPQSSYASILIVIVYLPLSGFFITMAVGSFMIKSWVRPLMLVASWFEIFMGIFICFIMYFMKPMIGEMSGDPATVNTPLFTIILLIIPFIFLILFPGLLAIFYTRNSVKLTFKKHDHEKYWTDKCSAPVLSLTFLMSLGGIFCFIYIINGFPFPLFGLILTGWKVRITWFIFGAAYLYLANRVFHTEKTAWLFSSILVLLILSSSIVSSFILGPDKLMELYSQYSSPMKYQKIAGLPQLSNKILILSSLIYAAYFVWLRPYFYKHKKQ